MNRESYDKVIIGAGIYGMYAAKRILTKNISNMSIITNNKI